MSLLIHELMIGTGSGGSTGSSGIHASSPSKSGHISSVNQTSGSFAAVSHNAGPLAVVTHNANSLQFSPLHQSRVVTISTSHSRLSTNENGSKLAEALTGNSSYAFTSTPLHVQTTQASTKLSNSAGSHSQWHHYAKTTSRQSYNLPFVLQDHNYGAPPPPTPPHSPPHHTAALPLSITKIQQVCSLNNGGAQKISSSNSNVALHTKKNTQHQKLTPDHTPPVTAVCPLSPSTSSPTKTNTASLAPPFLSSMPLHRQQFMPHPRLSGFHSPHIPSNVTTDIHAATTGPALSNGIDTDEESRLSDRSSSVGPSGEETETAPEGEGEELIQADDSITRCVCDFTHDDGYMIQCDRCLVWQHVDCMEIDRNNIPEEYLCEACSPRYIDKTKARALQVKRRHEIKTHLSRLSSSDSDDNASPAVSVAPKRNLSSKPTDRKVLKKKKPKTSKEQKSLRKQPPSYKKSPFVSPHNSSSKLHSSEEKERKPIVKSRRRQSSVTTASELAEDLTSSVMEYLKSWVEDYEVAVTNHYSPELRAKVHSARLLNGISPEFRDSTQGAMLGLRCKVAPNYNSKAEYFESKVLYATTDLLSGTAIIEFQGKYTLQSQWDSVMIPPGLPYLPFVLQYTMTKEGLGICIDARTYGNDARFARRNQEHNAEIRHVVERGSVHLYIVACKDIEEEDEIFLSLETAICAASAPPTVESPIPQKAPAVPIVPSDTNSLISVDDDDVPETMEDPHPVRKNGSFPAKKGSKKQQQPQQAPLSPIISQSTRPSRRTTSTESPAEDQSSPVISSPPTKQRRSSGCGSRSPIKSPVKSPSKSPLKSFAEESPKEDISPMSSPQFEGGSSSAEKDGHKMTREERKIAAYMKAFERMEKATTKRKEMAKRRVCDRPSDNDQKSNDNSNKENCEKPRMQMRKSIEGIGENRRKKRRKSSSSVDTPEKRPSDPNSNGFVDAADDNNGSSSEGERYKSPEGGNGLGSSSSFSIAGFRFPKTKKALMNEWLNETVDPVFPTGLPCSSDVSSGVPTCYMRSPSTPVRRASGSSSNHGSCNAASIKAALSLEMAGRSAKKRWLRQAIIDETEPQATNFAFCSSPNSRPDSPNGCIDYITPLKKRRLARESMSSEQSNTPPTTPIHSGIEEDKSSVEFENDHVLEENMEFIESKDTLDDAPVKEEVFIKEEKKSGILKAEDYHDSKEDIKDIPKDQLTVNIFELSKVCNKEIIMEHDASEMSIKSELPTEEEEEKDKPSNEDVEPSPLLPSLNEDASKRPPSSKSKEAIAKADDNPDGTSNLKKKNLPKSKLKLDIRKAKNKASETNIKRGFAKKDQRKKESSLSPIKKMRLAIKSSSVAHTLPKLPPNEKLNLSSDVRTRQSKKVKSKNKRASYKKKTSRHFEGNADTLNHKTCDLKKIDVITEKIIKPESKDIESEKDVKLYNPSSLKDLCQHIVSMLPKFPPHSPLHSLERGPKTPEGTPPETPIKASGEGSLCHESTTACNNDRVCSDETSLPSKESNLLSASSTLPSISEESPNNVAESSESDQNSSLAPPESLDSSSCTPNDDNREAKAEPEEAPTKPAPVKRKLSLLEYRKRKSINCEREVRDGHEIRPPVRSFSSDISSGMNPLSDTLTNSLWLDRDDSSNRHSKDSSLTQMDPSAFAAPVSPPSPMELDDLSNSPPSPPSPSIALKTYLESENDLDDKLLKTHSSLKWNKKPSLLEKHRENLTSRLRREFGLCLHEEGSRIEDLKKTNLAERRRKGLLNDKGFSALDRDSFTSAPSSLSSLKDRTLLGTSSLDAPSDGSSTLRMDRVNFASVAQNALKTPLDKLSLSPIEGNGLVVPGVVGLPPQEVKSESKGNATSTTKPSSQTELL